MKYAVLAVVAVLFVLWAFPMEAQTTTHKADMTCGASTTLGAQYNFYRADKPAAQGGTFKLLNSTPKASCAYSDLNLPANTQFCYRATAVAPGYTESAPSNEFCGRTLSDPTGSPGNLTGEFQ